MSRKYECCKCNTTINPEGKPVEDKGHYIRGPETEEKKKKKVLYGLKLSENQRKIRDQIMEKTGMAIEKANNIIAREENERIEELTGERIDLSNLEKVALKSPEEAKNKPDIIKVEKETVEVKERKTGLICKKCLDKNKHEIIW